MDNNVILLTNDNSIADILKPRLVLLREVDSILSVPYNTAISKLEQSIPETVLLYSSDGEEQECLKLINDIKNNPKTCNISILLIVESINQDFILSAYDNGIYDYMQIKSDDNIEVLIRAIWSFQRNAVARAAKTKTNLLKKLGIINFKTGFYTNGHIQDIFENEMELLKSENKQAILMLLGLAQESKLIVSHNDFISAIKASIRNSDVVIEGINDRFYILLTRTQLKSAFFILGKIKKILGEQVKVLASVTDVKDKSFEELDMKLLSGLCEVEASGEDLNVLEEENKTETSKDWLEKINSPQKNFKLFKQAFTKKLEKVITPVFFQMQKMYEDKLFETTIEQFSSADISEFVLKHSDNSAVLRITYPGFSKINIDYIYQGFDGPENDRLSLDLQDITDEKLVQIITKFIKEFKQYIDEVLE